MPQPCCRPRTVICLVVNAQLANPRLLSVHLATYSEEKPAQAAKDTQCDYAINHRPSHQITAQQRNTRDGEDEPAQRLDLR